MITRVFKEAAQNLTRNIPYAIAAIAVAMVSLVLVGLALVGKVGVDSFAHQWSNGIDFRVWMNANATQNEINAVSEQLKLSSNIKRCDYVDQAKSYQLVQSIFADNQVIKDSFSVSTTPSFFECVLTNPSRANVAYQEFANLPGVYTPQYPAQALRTLEQIITIVQVVLFSLALVMIIAAFLLVVTTVNLAIMARRKEIIVMRYVGATNFYISMPFILEGIIEGLLGAFLAFGVIYLLRNIVYNYVSKVVNSGSSGGQSLLSYAVATPHAALMIGLLLIVIGVLVSAFGAGFAVRRYLQA